VAIHLARVSLILQHTDEDQPCLPASTQTHGCVCLIDEAKLAAVAQEADEKRRPRSGDVTAVLTEQTEALNSSLKLATICNRVVMWKGMDWRTVDVKVQAATELCHLHLRCIASCVKAAEVMSQEKENSFQAGYQRIEGLIIRSVEVGITHCIISWATALINPHLDDTTISKTHRPDATSSRPARAGVYRRLWWACGGKPQTCCRNAVKVACSTNAHLPCIVLNVPPESFSKLASQAIFRSLL